MRAFKNRLMIENLCLNEGIEGKPKILKQLILCCSAIEFLFLITNL